MLQDLLSSFPPLQSLPPLAASLRATRLRVWLPRAPQVALHSLQGPKEPQTQSTGGPVGTCCFTPKAGESISSFRLFLF